ncbi:hypothetical protein B0H13DRAFT_1867083 [Mycena leptocephala]|nr:hypothetical protein B0H13DRAFT_1867083 [Mycena leptocephala]
MAHAKSQAHSAKTSLDVGRPECATGCRTALVLRDHGGAIGDFGGTLPSRLCISHLGQSLMLRATKIQTQSDLIYTAEELMATSIVLEDDPDTDHMRINGYGKKIRNQTAD